MEEKRAKCRSAWLADYASNQVLFSFPQFDLSRTWMRSTPVVRRAALPDRRRTYRRKFMAGLTARGYHRRLASRTRLHFPRMCNFYSVTSARMRQSRAFAAPSSGRNAEIVPRRVGPDGDGRATRMGEGPGAT